MEHRSIKAIKASNLCRELWDAGPDERVRHKLHMTNSNFSSLCRLFQYTQYTHIHTHTHNTDRLSVLFFCNIESTLMRAGPVLTAGWSLPRVFSLMANASLRRFAASLYLFWSLESRKHFHINLLRLIVQQRSFSQEAVSMATGWWHNSLISQRLGSRILP